MSSCVVLGCTNNSITSDSSIEYYPFPKNSFAQQWVELCGWQSTVLDVNTARICSIHFDEAAYCSEIKIVNFEACFTKTLKSDAMPTLYMPQSHILIKDNSLELENLKGVVVYTINSNNSNDEITISLEDDTGENQIFEIQPSTSDEVKVEEQTNLLKNEVDQGEKYSHIKSYPDLYVLQADNKSLKRNVEMLEEEVEALRNQLKETEEECLKYDAQYKTLEAKIANQQNMFTHQEQKKLLSKVFSEAQIKILFGKKKIYWSNDDMAVGYIVRHLSNKRCYTYITKKLNIPLPGISSVKRWIATNKSKKIRS